MRVTPRILIACVTLAAGVVFVTTLVRATVYAPDHEVASSTLMAMAPSREAAPGELPAYLKIPKLSIRAYVRHVGVNEAGNMATPGNFTDVGWYKYGTVPGFPGSAVIDGHVDNALALDGVFKHLGDLEVGDDVYIETASSTELHFKVIEVTHYKASDVPAERLFADTSGTYLNLVTCAGSWNKASQEYDDRLVVYTALVP